MTGANVRKEFGAAVRAYRQQLGLSQETLAERAELHRTYITDVERGARNISLESISRLARALDLSISSLFPPPTSRRGDDQKASTAAADAVDILLVEDDPKDVELTLRAFKEAGLSNRVEVVSDGQAALDFLFGEAAFAEGRQPSRRGLVVLLDLHLPKLHGLEILRRMRNTPLTSSTRVVVLTSSQDNADVTAALQLGAVAYIVKPLNFQSFSSITPKLNFSWTLQNPERASSEVRVPGRRGLKK
jgi:two-component system response regulator